jgi:outer membrane protein
MNRLLVPLALFVALASGAAHAQSYANRTLGLRVGYLKLNTDNGFDHAIPVGLEASSYIENGFELVAAFDFMILNQNPPDTNVVGIAPTLGFHYLFSEEAVRPYVGVDLSWLHIFGSNTDTANFFGLGPNLGVDVFVADSVSVGVKAQYNLYLALNGPNENSIGGAAVIKTYF